MKQILQAIEYCHSKGIAHTNLTPENIIVSEEGKKIVIKIIGFGSAIKYSNKTSFYN